jgi:hypothetical protein
MGGRGAEVFLVGKSRLDKRLSNFYPLRYTKIESGVPEIGASLQSFLRKGVALGYAGRN